MTTAELIASIHKSLDELESAIAAQDANAALVAIDARIRQMADRVTAGDLVITASTGTLGVAKS